jgi:hypothetical protein
MGFADPGALFWALLAVPLVSLYLLKVRLRRLTVPTMIFWRHVFQEKQARSLWQRLRHLLSLLLQLLLLALIVLGLAQPFFAGDTADARRFVLILDNSASMKATDVEPTRLDKARDEARRFISTLRFLDEAAVVTAGSQAQLVCGLTGHQRSLREAVNAAPASDGPTRIHEAVTLARRLLRKQRDSKILIFTDGCFEGCDRLAQERDVELVAVGQHTGNVGITKFQVRRSLLEPVGCEILVEVMNFSDEARTCRLDLFLKDAVVDVLPLTLEAGGSWRQVIEYRSAAGGVLTATLDPPDALLADNRAWALLPGREPLPVTLVSEGDWYLRNVLRAVPHIQLSMVKDLPQPADTSSARLASLLILHGQIPSTLPPGPVMVIDPRSSCDLWQLGDKLTTPVVAKQDDEAVLMAHVRLTNLLLPGACRMKLLGPGQVLASGAEGEPLLVAFERPAGRVVVLTVDLNSGELPWRVAFPVLMGNALAWLAGNLGELQEGSATGSLVTVDLPSPPTGPFVPLLRSPRQQIKRLPADTARLTVGPFDTCGVWAIDVATPTTQARSTALEIACNLTNARESDLRPPAGITPSAPMAAAFGLGGQPLWFYFLVSAWLLMGVEWFLYQRRWIS